MQQPRYSAGVHPDRVPTQSVKQCAHGAVIRGQHSRDEARLVEGLHIGAGAVNGPPELCEPCRQRGLRQGGAAAAAPTGDLAVACAHDVWRKQEGGVRGCVRMYADGGRYELVCALRLASACMYAEPAQPTLRWQLSQRLFSTRTSWLRTLWWRKRRWESFARQRTTVRAGLQHTRKHTFRHFHD